MKIGCILVLYNPSFPLLDMVVKSVENQVDALFLADNSDINSEHLIQCDKAIYKKMSGNVGIAAAQNEGIRFFLSQGFSHLFFLDQDSVLSSGLVNQLVDDWESLEKNHVLIGGIAARPINRKSGKKYQASTTQGSHYSDNLTEVGEIMNSSSLITAKNFSEVGLFEEGLFIDGVDHEWCWRASMLKDFRFFISEKAQLSHQLGEGDRFFIIRDVAIPTPFRSYYQFRNYFILLRRKYVPLHWKILNGFKYFIKLFYFPLFVKPKRAYLKNSLRGIRDGLFIK